MAQTLFLFFQIAFLVLAIGNINAAPKNNNSSNKNGEPQHHVRIEYRSARPTSTGRRGGSLEDRELEIHGQIIAQGHPDTGKFNIGLFWYTPGENNAFTPLVTRVSGNRAYEFRLSVRNHLLPAKLNINSRDAQLCTYISGFSVATTGMFCEPNPLAELSDDDLFHTRKRYNLGPFSSGKVPDADDDNKRLKRKRWSEDEDNDQRGAGGKDVGDSRLHRSEKRPSSRRKAYTKNTSITVNINGRIRQSGNYRVTVSMDPQVSDKGFVKKVRVNENNEFKLQLTSTDVNSAAADLADNVRPQLTLYVEDVDHPSRPDCVYPVLRGTENPFDEERTKLSVNIDLEALGCIPTKTNDKEKKDK